jgi:hypothetical protein
MKLNPNHKKVVFVAVLAIALFYWFQIRPSQIKKACAKQSSLSAHQMYLQELEKYPTLNKKEIERVKNEGIFLTEQYEGIYRQCLSSKGL